MFMPHLPGREYNHEQEEAESALEALIRAQEIQESDPEFLSLVRSEISRKMDILTRISKLVDCEDEYGEEATTEVSDFFSRLSKHRSEEDMKSEESPNQRRLRILKF